MRPRRYLPFLTTLLLLSAGATARAQVASGAATSPSSGEEGNPRAAGSGGIRLGSTFILKLSMLVEFDWDSNVFFQPDNGPEKPTNAFFMRLNPGFLITNQPRLGARAITLNLHGGLSYIEYLTSNSNLAGHRQFNVDAGVEAAFFTTSPYNFSVFDNYVRTTQPAYTSTSPNINRDTNEVGFRLSLSPGGGRLTFYIGYLFGIDYFENQNLQDYNLQYHRIDVRASWRFLPKTAVYVAANETIYLYPNPGTSGHPNSFPLRVDAGIQGLITTKLTVNAYVGYGNGFYQWPATAMAQPNPNTVIAGLSLGWRPTMLSTGAIGYQHDFQNSLLGAYYDEDMVYVTWSQLVWRFTGFIRAQYTNMRFKGVQLVQATTDGTDNNFQLRMRVDYPFKNWLISSVGYDLYLNRSDRMLITMPGTGGPAPGTVPVDYTKHVVYLSLSFQY
jgi:hypothetical protein